MKKFICGALTGATIAVGTVGAAVYIIKKTVIEPAEEKEQDLDENRRRAARKSHARTY